VFQRIRRGTDADSVLRHVNHGDILIQLALVPEARYRYEFPYLPDMPSFLRQMSNPYLDSDVYEYSLRGTPEPATHQQGRQQPQQEPRDGPERDPYLKPYSSATVLDPWLDSVQPSKWTTVSCDDSLLRKILHDYFLFEYDWFTYFHKDYFLEDMAAENKRFCSSLLANAVLCVGCVSVYCIPMYRSWLTSPVLPPRPPGACRVLEPQEPGIPIPRRGQALV
jgi:hypothetical protein